MGARIPKNTHTIPEKTHLLENAEELKREKHPEFDDIVFLRDKRNGEIFLKKQIIEHNDPDLQRTIDFLAFRQSLNSSCILNLLDFTSKEKKTFCSSFFKVNCYYEGFDTDLKSEIEHRRPKKLYFSEEEILELCASIATALRFLHKKMIPMVEIKPTNIVKTKNGYKLTNRMGVSTNLGEILSSLFARSVVYVAPEIWSVVHSPTKKNMLDESYDADVFSLGLLLLEAGTLEPLANLYNGKKINKEALQERFEQFHERYPDLDWVVNFFSMLPSNRYSIREILDITGKPGETKQRKIKREMRRRKEQEQEENSQHFQNSPKGSENIERAANQLGMIAYQEEKKQEHQANGVAYQFNKESPKKKEEVQGYSSSPHGLGQVGFGTGPDYKMPDVSVSIGYKPGEAYGKYDAPKADAHQSGYEGLWINKTEYVSGLNFGGQKDQESKGVPSYLSGIQEISKLVGGSIGWEKAKENENQQGQFNSGKERESHSGIGQANSLGTREFGAGNYLYKMPDVSVSIGYKPGEAYGKYDAPKAAPVPSNSLSSPSYQYSSAYGSNQKPTTPTSHGQNQSPFIYSSPPSSAVPVQKPSTYSSSSYQSNSSGAPIHQGSGSRAPESSRPSYMSTSSYH